MAGLPRGFFAGDVVEQAAEGEVVLVAVEAPCWAGVAGTGQDVFGHDRPGVTCPGEAGDLEPRGAAAVFAGRRVEPGVGDPRGMNRFLQPDLDLGSREQVGIQVAGAAAESRRVDAGDLLAGLGRFLSLQARALAGPANTELAGGSEEKEEKEEKAIAQPVWVAEVHSGTFVNVDPITLPEGTWRFPPTNIATSRRRSTCGWWSSWAEMRWIRIVAPCESPIKMIGLPPVWARNHCQAGSRLS